VFTGRAAPHRRENGLEDLNWTFPLRLGIFSRRLENDFQRPRENEARRHFQMFGLFTRYGGTAPLNIGGRPEP
jgi:hypothetical protein